MRNLRLTFLALLLLACINTILQSQEAQWLYTEKEHPDMLPELSERGEASIGVKTYTITNANYINPLTGEIAPRSLKTEIWYPTSANSADDAVYKNQTRNGIPFAVRGNAIRDAAPVDLTDRSIVVISHGYTGYRTIMYYLGEHLASHGYVVISLDHTDSTNEDVDPKLNPYSGFQSTLLNRSRDQQLVLDYFSVPANADAVFPNGFSIKNAGIIGYSMGGYGAINTIGGCYDFSEQFASRLTMSKDPDKIAAAKKVYDTCAGGQPKDNFTVDPRWKAMIAFAPWGGEAGAFDNAAIRKIKVPSLYISGNLDDVSGYEGIKKQYEQMTATDRYLLTYINARHNVAPHPAPKEAWETEYDFGHHYEPAWSTQQLNRINQHFSLAMMDCYLKDDKTACEYLDLPPSSDQVRTSEKPVAPWKGFDNRYGTGMTWGKMMRE
jgi:predicted dienelactone hydrolase